MSDAAEISPGRTLWEALGDIPDRRGAKGRRYLRFSQSAHWGSHAGSLHQLRLLHQARNEGCSNLSRCAQAGQRIRAVIPSFDRI
jgi:hypothetical protein